jgi:hypothetical protein
VLVPLQGSPAVHACDILNAHRAHLSSMCLCVGVDAGPRCGGGEGGGGQQVGIHAATEGNV